MCGHEPIFPVFASFDRECTNFLWHKFFLNNLILAIKSNIREQRKIYMSLHWVVTIVLNKNFYVWINLNRLANCYNITRAIPLKCHHLIMQAVEDVCYILSPIIIAFQHCFPFCNIYWGNDIRSLQVMRQAIQTKSLHTLFQKYFIFPFISLFSLDMVLTQRIVPCRVSRDIIEYERKQ